MRNKNFTSQGQHVVNWPDTLTYPIYVKFKFSFSENPVSNATIIDCQNQTKLYAGWKLYFRGTANTLVLNAGTMGSGTTTNETIYSYKKLELDTIYTINLKFTSESISISVDGSETILNNFSTSLPILWDPTIYFGKDNQYTNRSLVNNKFNITRFHIYY